MKKSKSLLVALLAALSMSACTQATSSSQAGTSSTVTPSSTVSSTVSSSEVESTSSSSSVDTVGAIIEEIRARIVFVKDRQEVTDDFEVPSVVKFNYEGTEIQVNLTWTADKDNVSFVEEEGKLIGKLNRPAFGEESVLVKLTASFTYEGREGSKGFRVTVMPKTGLDDVWGVAPTGTPLSWSEFRAAEKGTVVTIQGRVLAWTYDGSYGNGNVFLQDENGGYYAYRLKAALSEYEDYLAIGNEVIIEGKKDVYSGLHQLGQNTVTGIKVVDRTNAGTRPEAKDVTTAAKNGELEPLQSTWATVLGTYTIGSDGYKYIQVGGNKYQIYSDKKYNGENLDEVNAQIATLAEGDTIRITGIVGVYTNPQFYPYNVVKSDEVITVSPEEKIAIAKQEVFAGFSATYEANAEVALWASSDADVTVSYALNAEANTSVFALGNDKLTITPTETEEKATITATFTCGAVTDTATFEVTAKLPSADVNSYVLTADNLGLGAYAAGTKSVGGVEWGYTELGSYGDGIQMRIKEGRTASLWNNTATVKAIKEIRLTYSDTKSTYDNTAAFNFDFGTTAEVNAYTTTLDTVKDVKEYVVTPDAETYTYFKMTLNLTYSFYWKSIEIVLADVAVEPEEPEVPETPIDTNSTLLTADNLELGAYAAGTKTVNGIEWGYTELGSYGDGIQMRIKNGNTASLWNNTATPRAIKEIKLTYSETKSTYDNTAAFNFDFGTTTEVNTYTTTLDTVKDVKEYVVTPDAETYTYFKMTLNLTYSFYWQSIEVVYADAAVEPEEPVVPEEPETPVVAESTTVVIGTYATDNAWENGVQYTTLPLGKVTATATFDEEAQYQNTGKYYTSDSSWRFYASDTGALVLTAEEGYVITSINVTFTSGTFEGLTSETDYEVNAATASFACTKNARILSITVNYAPAA